MTGNRDSDVRRLRWSGGPFGRWLLGLMLSMVVVGLSVKWLLHFWGPIRLAMALILVGIGVMWLGYAMVRFRLVLVTAGFFIFLAGAYAGYGNSVPYPPHFRFTAWGGIPDDETDLEGNVPSPGVPLVAVGATGADEPETMIVRLGCGACHKIPTTSHRFVGVVGPVLILKDTAPLRISSPEYQRQFKAGKAHAQTAKDYVIESIVNPDAYIVPGFAQPNAPQVSLMPSDYKNEFTYEALNKLAEFLLTLDEAAAARDGLVTEPLEAADVN